MISDIKQGLTELDDQTQHDILMSFAGVFGPLRGEIDAFIKRVERAKSLGVVITPEWLYSAGGLRILELHIRLQLESFGQAASLSIASAQQAAIALAQADLGTYADALGGEAVSAGEVAAGLMGNGETLLASFAELASRLTLVTRATVLEGVKGGLEPRQLGLSIEQVVAQAATSGLRTASTETMRVYRENLLADFKQNKMLVRGWGWISRLDKHTCIMCILMHGTSHLLSEPFASHPQCVPAGAMVVASTPLATTSRRFEGKVVDVETALGHHLTVTENHPILTSRGWVAAGLLNESDHVVSSRNPQRVISIVSPDDNSAPALIEEIIESFGSAGGMITRSMPATPKDFHGDGEGSNINVVGSDRLLWDNVNAPLSQHFTEGSFGERDITGAGLTTTSVPYALTETGLPPLAGTMSGSAVAPILFRGSLCHHHAVSLTGLAQFDSGLSKNSFDSRAHDAEFLGQSEDGFSSDVTFHDFDFGQSGERLVVGLDLQAANPSGFSQGSPQSLSTQVAAKELLRRVKARSSDLATLSTEIRFDRVTKISVRDFVGQVYNLQTNEGWYISNGIITHNCRCIPVPKSIIVTFEDFQSGRDWFLGKPGASQEAILGKAGYKAYTSGEVKLDDFIGRTRSEEWGPGRYVKSLKKILGAQDAVRFYQRAS